MGKKKTRARKKEVYSQLMDLRQTIAVDSDESDEEFETSNMGSTMMKKFRFQLLHEWLISEVAPCRAIDIGGGKGLLTYLLNKSGWDATVVDPAYQELPTKYKDFQSKKRVIIAAEEKVPRVSRNFDPAMASDVDLLIGLHAHGCNVQVIDACTKYNIGFVLLPCCVIDEPFYPRRGATWVGSLTDYALREGFDVRPFQLGFRGQNIGIYAPPKS